MFFVILVYALKKPFYSFQEVDVLNEHVTYFIFTQTFQFLLFFLNILTCHLYIFFYELSECSEQVSDDLALTLWCFPYLLA